MAVEGHFPEGGAPEVAVFAEDRLQDLRMTRRTRTFVDKSDAELFRQLASDHGLQANVDAEGPTHRVLAQVNLSDLAFMRSRCRAVDAELWVDGATLHVKSRSKRSSTPLELVYNSGLRSFRVCADLAHQRSSVRATGWSPDDKRAISHDATDSAVRSELGNDESGASILRSKLAARSEVVAHTCPGNEGEARARAEAYFRQSARRFVSGEGVAAPTPRLRAGATVKLKGLGPMFEGNYYVSESRWVFDETGLRVDFRAERPGIGRA
jgi:phage protein D